MRRHGINRSSINYAPNQFFHGYLKVMIKIFEGCLLDLLSTKTKQYTEFPVTNMTHFTWASLTLLDRAQTVV